jgi:hypothetical protein
MQLALWHNAFARAFAQTETAQGGAIAGAIEDNYAWRGFCSPHTGL